MIQNERPIGVFDSGIGGISVLRQAVKVLPNENFVYFGDSKNAPYGTRELQEVKKLTLDAVDFLMRKDAKAIVIACNTATSAVIKDIRNMYKDIPVIGIEPALKPAVELKRKGKIVIMATNLTLAETKFKNLMEKYAKVSEIVKMPCPGLVEFVESGNFEGKEVHDFLKEKFKHLPKDEIAAIVLGCTHYPFAKKELMNVVGDDIPIIDGSLGTAKQLKKKLMEKSIISSSNERGSIKIYNSFENEKIISLCYKLLQM